MADGPSPEPRWLLLIHQIPPTPAYLRVKIARRLQRVGAVAIKNTVYVLPRGEQATEDLQWIVREVVAGGGEATLCEARLVDGLHDGEVEALFRAARDADYEEIAAEARRAAKSVPSKPAKLDEMRAGLEAEAARLRKRLEDVQLLDFFGAPSRLPAATAIAELEARLAQPKASVPVEPAETRESYQRRTWVTRTGVFVDRIASAWLIRRFIDPEATFKFVKEGYKPARREVRFDMFEAEFTHEGDECTFEVLVRRLAVHEPGLQGIAEIVHDIDIKDGKFARPETAGVAAMLTGIAQQHRDDIARIEASSPLLDALLGYYRRHRG